MTTPSPDRSATSWSLAQEIDSVDAVRAPVAGIPVSRGQPAGSAIGPASKKSKDRKRARKGQRADRGDRDATEVPDFVRENGSSGWIRTSNPPVNRTTLNSYRRRPRATKVTRITDLRARALLRSLTINLDN